MLFNAKCCALRFPSIVLLWALQLAAAAGHPFDDGSLAMEAVVQEGNTIGRTKNAREAATAYERFFERFGKEGVRAFKANPNDGIALRAAWEEVRLTIGKTESIREAPVNSQALYRFLGFVEGRLHTSVPNWWKEPLVGAQAFRRDRVLFPKGNWTRDHRAGLGFHAPRDTVVEKVNGHFLLTIGKASAPIPKVVIDEGEKHSGPCISALFDSHYCFVAVHGDTCSPYTLFRIDTNTGTVQWKTRVWAEGGLIGGYSGPNYHWITFSLEKDRILVYGVGDCLYVEAFDPKDGINLFRFSTSY